MEKSEVSPDKVMDRPDLNKTKVLALSGGGYRGLFSVQVLAKIEEATGRPITEDFDLIAGTSIGGIIALALAAGHRPKDLVEIFKKHGDSIFPKPRWKIVRSLWLFKAIGTSYYDAKGLTALLIELFQDKKMKDLNQAYVIIPTANASTGHPKFFKTPHHGELYYDKKVLVLDVALATSAAPVFFPLHKIETLNARFIDGGLVGNAPGLFGFIEAQTRLGKDPDGISVLAIGTLAGSPNISAKSTFRGGVWFWLNPISRRLLELMFATQERQTHNMLNILLKERYHIIDSTVSAESSNDIGLDETTKTAQEALLSRANQEAQNFTNTLFFKEHLKPQEGITHDQP